MLLLVASLIASQDAGVARVVASMAAAAKANAAKPDAARLSGDELADLYIRSACKSEAPARDIVLGLAYCLEPTSLIAKNPFLGATFANVETAEERKSRLAAMGKPTLRGRQDLLSHFVVSAGLQVAIGEKGAEAAGVLKEVADAKAKEQGSGSGFSFSDLSADLAGIEFAKWLTGPESKERLQACAKSFRGANFLPDPMGLKDGLTWTEFQKDWGSASDPKFLAERDRLREEARRCKGYLPLAPLEEMEK